MISFPYFMEILLYSVLNFLPFTLLTLYPFRDRLRASPLITALGLLCNAIIHFATTILKYYSPYNWLLSLGCTLIHALFMLIWIKDHFGKSLFTLLMMTNLSNFVLVASKCLEGILFPQLAVEFHHWSHSLTTLIVECIVLTPLYFYMKNIYTNAVKHNSSRTLWRYLWLIPLTFYAVWFRNFYFSAEGALELALRPRHTLYSFVVNAGAMLSYYMVSKLINEYVHNEQLQEKAHQLSMQHAQYGFLQDRIDEARRARHDVRQHLHVISAYLKEKKYEELELYINRYQKSQPEEVPLVFCENPAINALLQYFAGHAKVIGAGFSCSVHLPKDAGIPDEVLTVVLGNLLENAMEACTSIDTGTVVSVRGKADESAIFFKVVNTCPKIPKTDKAGRFLSSKRKGYGIGLRSVESIATQYGGLMKAFWEDGTFTVSVMLNRPEDPAHT